MSDQTMREAFLPCPFCGSTDIRIDKHRGERPVYSMCCYMCGATFPNCYSKEAQYAKWNRRAAPAQSEAKAVEMSAAGIRGLMSEPFELNMSNYTELDVANLNDWAIRAYDALHTLVNRVTDADAPAGVGEANVLPIGVLQALRFYANGEHFMIDDQQDFDTVSGEPVNWLFSTRDDDCTMIEDGSVAKAALLGKACDFEESPVPVEGEAFTTAAPPVAAAAADVGRKVVKCNCEHWQHFPDCPFALDAARSKQS